MKNLLCVLVFLFSIYSCGNGTKNEDQNNNITVEQELDASKNDKEMVDLYNLQINNFLKQEELLRNKITQFKANNQKDSVDYSFYLLKKGQKESYKYSRIFIEKNVNSLAGAYVFQNCIGKFKSRKIFSEKEIFEIEDQIKYVVDINPHKQGKYAPGTGQEIVSPQYLEEYRPDTVILMNPLYLEEVGNVISDLGFSSTIITV